MNLATLASFPTLSRCRCAALQLGRAYQGTGEKVLRLNDASHARPWPFYENRNSYTSRLLYRNHFRGCRRFRIRQSTQNNHQHGSLRKSCRNHNRRTMQQEDEPYLKSYRHFQRYEHYLKEIVDRWPAAIILQPRPPVFSVDTLATRLRICITSLQDHLRLSPDEPWPVTFNLQRFTQISDEIVISAQATPGGVLCGPATAVRKRIGMLVEQPIIDTVNIPAKTTITRPDEATLRALIQCYASGVLTIPSEVETTLPIEQMCDGKDVACERVGDNKYILL